MAHEEYKYGREATVDATERAARNLLGQEAVKYGQTPEEYTDLHAQYRAESTENSPSYEEWLSLDTQE